MILRLATPPVQRSIPSLRVVRWHRAEGDEVAFGALLVELRAEGTLRRLQPAGAGSRAQRRRRRDRATDDKTGDVLAEDAPRFRLEVFASEPGYLRRVLAGEGTSVTPGDPLADLTTTPDEAIDGAGAPHAYRAVADVIRIDSDLLAEDL